MSLKYGFFDSEFVGGLYDREYNSEDFSKSFQGIMEDGIIGIDEARETTSLGFKVTESSSQDNYVLVNAGMAWIKGRWVQSDGETLQLERDSSPGVRIDRVVLRCNFTNREFVVVVKKGENIPSGADPEDYIPGLANSTTMKEISLAKVGVVTTNEEMILAIDDDRVFSKTKVVSARDMSAYYTANEVDQAFEDYTTYNLGGLRFAKCTQDEYDNMQSHRPDTVYFIVEPEE